MVNQIRRGRRALMGKLEPRVLFDGVPDADFLLPVERDNPLPFVVEVAAQSEADVKSDSELIIVDPRVEDASVLLGAVVDANPNRQYEIRYLQSDEGGIQQVTDILASSNGGYSAIHVLSHGSDGELQLGNEWINNDNLGRYVEQIQSWSGAMTDSADILFYGCDLAASDAGVALVERVALLTGADVAASDDLTGSKLLDGDWQLEVSTGEIQAAVLESSIFGSVLGPGEIRGAVIDDTGPDDVGLAGVSVSVFDDNNQTVGTAVSDSNGDYVIAGLANGTNYRVVFTGLPDGFESSVIDGASGGSVVFSAAGGADVDFTVHRPQDYCDSNPDLAVPCYIQGTHDGLATNESAIVTVEHDFDGSSQITTLATIGQVGSTYGMAYQTDSDLIYSAAFLKRNSGMGPEGMDAIYLIDATNGGYANSSDGAIPIAIHLSDFGIDVGAELSSAARGLSDDPADLVLDQWGWDNQFRLGIGDIDLSDDGNTLYVMNLNDHDGNGTHGQLVILDVSDPANVSLKGTVDIPNLIPGAVDSDIRSFATKFENGRLYIGVTATAESTQDRADLSAAVYQLNLSETAFSLVSIDSSHAYNDGLDAGPTTVIPLDYERGNAYELGTLTQSANFQPWTNDASLYDTASFVSRPQPLLTDIEFDDDGSMILAFANRDAYQIGDFDLYPGSGTDARPGLIAGELLRVQATSTGFELEGDVAAPSNATGASHLGIAGGEFYFRENFFSLHDETTMGALALLPGSGEIVMTMVDPFQVHSGGLSRLSNTTGGNRADVELYNLGSPGTAAKGAGLGDLEVICRAAPVEIGNYLWFDTDADGIQDAGEASLANVLVGLYDDTGALIATVETDATGQYLFSSGTGTDADSDGDGTLEFAYGLNICADDCEYTIGVLDSNFADGGTLEGYRATTSNVQGTANDEFDNSDSDAVAVSVGAGANVASNGVELVVGQAGENNHTYDFGFTLLPISPIDSGPDPVNPVVPVNPVCPATCEELGVGRVSDLLVLSPVPVYAGTPIGTSSNPLSFDSGLPVQGGVLSPVDCCCYEEVISVCDTGCEFESDTDSRPNVVTESEFVIPAEPVFEEATDDGGSSEASVGGGDWEVEGAGSILQQSDAEDGAASESGGSLDDSDSEPNWDAIESQDWNLPKVDTMDETKPATNHRATEHGAAEQKDLERGRSNVIQFLAPATVRQEAETLMPLRVDSLRND